MLNINEIIENHDRNSDYCYKKEIWIMLNPDEAFNGFINDADSGDPLGLLWLGYCHQCGYGTKNDEKLAVQCYEKAFAYRNNSDNCSIIEYNMCKLGDCYMRGWGTERNEKAALECLEISVKAGNTKAMKELADFYDKKNKGKALAYLDLSANCGEVDSMIKLGDYYTGFTTKHQEGGFYLDGHRETYSEDNFVGFQNPIDAEKGFAWYKRANIKYRLACCYYGGIGTKKDWAKAVELFQGLEHDSYMADALYNCYSTGGNGLERNWLKAAKWLAISLLNMSD